MLVKSPGATGGDWSSRATSPECAVEVRSMPVPTLVPIPNNDGVWLSRPKASESEARHPGPGSGLLLMLYRGPESWFRMAGISIAYHSRQRGRAPEQWLPIMQSGSQ